MPVQSDHMEECVMCADVGVEAPEETELFEKMDAVEYEGEAMKVKRLPWFIRLMNWLGDEGGEITRYESSKAVQVPEIDVDGAAFKFGIE